MSLTLAQEKVIANYPGASVKQSSTTPGNVFVYHCDGFTLTRLIIDKNGLVVDRTDFKATQADREQQSQRLKATQEVRWLEELFETESFEK